MKYQKHHAVLALVGAMSSLQVGTSFAKYLIRMLGPSGVVVLRVGIAGVLLSLICRPKIRAFTRCEWMMLALYGISIGLMNLSFYYAIKLIPIGVCVTVEYAGPLAVALVKSRKFTDFLWALLAAVGIVLIMPWPGADTALSWAGIFFAVLAGVFWACYILMTDRISTRMKSTDAVSCGLCISALTVLPFGFASGDLFCLDGKLLLMGCGVAVLASAIPFLLDMLSLKKLDSKTFSVIQSVEPAVAALSGLCFLGEVLTLKQWIAILFVMAASAGAAVTAKEKEV